MTKRWYVATVENGIEFLESEEEARKAAQEEIDFALKDHWPDGIEGVEWGEAIPRQHAVQVDLVETPGGENDYTCRYVLKDSGPPIVKGEARDAKEALAAWVRDVFNEAPSFTLASIAGAIARIGPPPRVDIVRPTYPERPLYVKLGPMGGTPASVVLTRDKYNTYWRHSGAWGLTDGMVEGKHVVTGCGNTDLIGMQIFPATLAEAIEDGEASEPKPETEVDSDEPSRIPF